MHSHLLPGIDDGAKDEAQTLAMVGALGERGLGCLWTTPHVMVDFYGNDNAGIEAALQDTRLLLSRDHVETELFAAAEYFLDEGFSKILEDGGLRCFPGKRVLVEWSMIAAPAGLTVQIKRLISAGFTPVIAHPERYGYWQQHPGRWRELRLLGCQLQVNLLSLVGRYGDGALRCAMALLSSNAVAFAATDSHALADVEALDGVLADRSIAETLRSVRFLNQELA